MVTDNDSTLNTIQAIAITPDGTKAYISNYDGDSVSIMDTTSDTITGTVMDTNNTFVGPNGIAITPDGNRAYVCNDSNNTVSIIDIDTNTVTGTVTSSSQLSSPGQITITSDGKTAYVTNWGNTISVISTDPLAYAYNTVTGSILSSSISGPRAIALTPNGDYGYICSIENDSVNVLYTQYTLPIQAPTDISLITGLLENASASNYINKISWTPPTDGPIVEAYKIYSDAGLSQLVATVPAGKAPVFIEYNCTANTLYNYYIVSVDTDDNLSAPLHGSITTLP